MRLHHHRQLAPGRSRAGRRFDDTSPVAVRFGVRAADGYCRSLPADAVIMGGMDEVFGLFPTPFLRAPGTLSARLVDGLVQHFSTLALDPNKASDNLSHTAMLRPGDSPLLVEAATLITPKIVDLGALMFGERLDWAIKEMWVNAIPGGLDSWGYTVKFSA